MRNVWMLVLGLTATFAARADLVSSTGSVDLISPPASVVVNVGLESDTNTFTFTERRDLILAAPVAVNITSAGTYTSTAGLTPGTIAAGTEVDSYYLHSDPVGSSASPIINYVGSVTFNTDILGVIVLDAQFAASNATLGHPGTLYSSSGQGLELGSPTDSVTLTVSGKTLSYNLDTNTAADDIRIITAGSVPEPQAWILLLTCIGLCFALMRTRRAAVRDR